MRKFLLIVSIFAAFTFESCKKEQAIDQLTDRISNDYYPLKTGSIWIYSVSDTSFSVLNVGNGRTVHNYDVKIVITGTQKLADNKDAIVMQYTYPWGTEQKYVRLDNDTIKLIEANDLNSIHYPNGTFVLPLVDNKTWTITGGFWNTTAVNDYRCKEIADYNNNYIHLNNVFSIDCSINDLETSFANQTFVIKPKIGLVEKYIHLQGVDNYDGERWQLKSFQLN